MVWKKIRPFWVAAIHRIRRASVKICPSSHKWSGPITVVGALILFFGTVANYTLKDHYATINSRIQGAMREQLLDVKLSEIATDISQISSQPLKLETDPHPKFADLQQEWKVLRSELDIWNEQYHTLLSTRAFCFSQFAISYVATVKTSTQDALRAEYAMLTAAISELDRTKDAYLKSLNELWQTDSRKSLDDSEAKIAAYRKTWQKVEAHMDSTIKNVHDSSDALAIEIRSDLDSVRRSARMWSNLTILLYVIGSLVTLYGQFFDKVFPKLIAETETVPPQSPIP